MGSGELDVVTGACGFTGQYITRRLLSTGRKVRTLTGHPDRPNPFGDRVSVVPFHFDNPRELARSLEGAATLYNTYWIRFPYGRVAFQGAVENTKALIQAAEAAGVRRLVHLSITNASEDSRLPYFRGKALVETAIIRSRLSWAILRPTVIFGAEDILINNLAWLLRRFPVFAVPGSGRYRLQPVFVEDVAELAVSAAQLETNVLLDTVGPETYTVTELVRLIAGVVRSRARIVHLRPALALCLSRLVGYVVGDVLLTRDELEGLMENLLVSDRPPTGHTSLRRWLSEHADRVGSRYASELDRHYR